MSRFWINGRASPYAQAASARGARDDLREQAWATALATVNPLPLTVAQKAARAWPIYLQTYYAALLRRTGYRIDLIEAARRVGVPADVIDGALGGEA